MDSDAARGPVAAPPGCGDTRAGSAPGGIWAYGAVAGPGLASGVWGGAADRGWALLGRGRSLSVPQQVPGRSRPRSPPWRRALGALTSRPLGGVVSNKRGRCRSAPLRPRRKRKRRRLVVPAEAAALGASAARSCSRLRSHFSLLPGPGPAQFPFSPHPWSRSGFLPGPSSVPIPGPILSPVPLPVPISGPVPRSIPGPARIPLPAMAVRASFENNNELGCFAKLTNAYCLVAIGGSENFYR